MYPLEDKHLTREEIRLIVAEAHVWQRRADLRRVDLRMTNLIGADLREADLEEANLSGVRLDNAILLQAVLQFLQEGVKCQRLEPCSRAIMAIRRG